MCPPVDPCTSVVCVHGDSDHVECTCWGPPEVMVDLGLESGVLRESPVPGFLFTWTLNLVKLLDYRSPSVKEWVPGKT